MRQLDFPLIDLHRHLEGSMRPQTILELGEKYRVPLARDLDGVRKLVQVTEPLPDLVSYLVKNDQAVTILGDLDACTRITYESIEDASKEGIVYLELRFSPYFMANPNQLDLAGVVEAVVDGAKRGQRDFGVRTNLIGILSRTFGPQITMRELEALLTHHEQIVALDLAGDEARWPCELFVEHFLRGRDVGWHVTVHAGEAAGSQGIWQAVNELGAERIGHGVRATEDPALLDFLIKRQISLEISLTSNVQTNTVPDYSSHPLRFFLKRGLLATINTDNPTASNVTLPHELFVAAPAAGLSEAMIRQAQANALEVAFLSVEDKAALRGEA